MAAPSRPRPSTGQWRLGWLRGQGSRWLLITCLTLVCFAVAAAGAIGSFRYVDTYWLYRGFPPPFMPKTVFVGHGNSRHRVSVILTKLRRISVRSDALGGFADPVYVVLPPGYDSHPSARYPVLYLLHGTPGEPSNFLTVGQVQQVEATLVAARKMKPLILVIPTGGRTFFSDEQWVNGVTRGNKWETFVATDLVKVIDARYRTVDSPAGRGIAGLSEGGYGALNIGLHHPTEFRLIESWSGYMTAEPYIRIFGWNKHLLTYNSPSSWVRTVAPQLRADHTYIWFYCGLWDSSIRQDHAFAEELTRLHIRHRFFLHAGGHSWALWRRLMPHALVSASEHLGHA
jgi:enterochelin esterase-like enzyme